MGVGMGARYSVTIALSLFAPKGPGELVQQAFQLPAEYALCPAWLVGHEAQSLVTLILSRCLSCLLLSQPQQQNQADGKTELLYAVPSA